VTIGYQAYQANAVQTATPEQLVVMLYDGCLKFLRRAEAAAANGPCPPLTDAVARASAIVMELNATLDMERGGDIAQNLRSLYLFLQRHLNEAMFEGSPTKVRQAIGIVAELREAFAHAAKQVKAA
jgi:flagellar protein FliS